jgi:actin-like protein 6A
MEKIDSDSRKELINNIMVVGGNSLLPNFVERLQKELQEIDLFGYQSKIKIYTPPNAGEKSYSSWLGASIIGCMA